MSEFDHEFKGRLFSSNWYRKRYTWSVGPYLKRIVLEYENWNIKEISQLHTWILIGELHGLCVYIYWLILSQKMRLIVEPRAYY